MNHRLITAVMSLALLAMILPAFGNVYWKRGAGAGRALFDALPEWRRVYQSTLRINESRGRLEILGGADALPRVMARLKNAFATTPTALFRHNDSAGWGLIHAGDTVTRVLTLNLGAPEQTVVFVLTQSRGDYERSLKPPAAPRLDEAPCYPGSIVQSFIEDETAAAQVEISKAPGRPESIWSFFESAFEQQGYHQIQVGVGQGFREAGIALFQKGTSLCCVQVQASPEAHESVITVLHKQLRME